MDGSATINPTTDRIIRTLHSVVDDPELGVARSGAKGSFYIRSLATIIYNRINNDPLLLILNMHPSDFIPQIKWAIAKPGFLNYDGAVWVSEIPIDKINHFSRHLYAAHHAIHLAGAACFYGTRIKSKNGVDPNQDLPGCPLPPKQLWFSEGMPFSLICRHLKTFDIGCYCEKDKQELFLSAVKEALLNIPASFQPAFIELDGILISVKLYGEFSKKEYDKIYDVCLNLRRSFFPDPILPSSVAQSRKHLFDVKELYFPPI